MAMIYTCLYISESLINENRRIYTCQNGEVSSTIRTNE